MRKRRLALVIMAGLAVAAAGSVVAIAINVATGGSASWFPAMDRYPLWWTIGATFLVAAAGLLAWQAQRRYDQALAELIPAAQQPEPWWVSRPDEVGQVITALKRKGGGTVGITTTLHGAGGFGKTTIAKMTRSDPRLLRRYRGRVYWVTVGRDAGKPALTGLVNDLITQLDPGRAVTFTDARQAAEHLAALLARGPQRLLIVDDVWTQEQLDAFPVAGKCARLVTTRIPSLTAGTAVPVRVDEMTPAQARALLHHGLASLPPGVSGGLLAETGCWPLLLRLANKILTSQAALGADTAQVAEDLLARLRQGGALQADELSGTASRHLDLGDPDQRATAVRATIEASTSLLTPAEASRLAELAVFAEDETIPLPLITALWHATSDTSSLDATVLAARLADLALLTPVPGGGITMHDVIRDYFRTRLGLEQLARLHVALLSAAAVGLPAAPASGGGTVTAWWQLPVTSRYLYDHLIEHLIAAGQAGEAEATASDLRWAAARLGQAGPAALFADLALIATPSTQRLQRLISQSAHLLAPTQPGYSLTDILLSRVGDDPDWGPQAQAITATGLHPALRNAARLPDLPNDLQRRTFTGHGSWVSGVAIAPDGTWLATAGEDGTARTWDAVTGQPRLILTGHGSRLTAVAIAPDGTWLATAGSDGTVRTWDAVTGQPRLVLTVHTIHSVTAVAIAPDGTWLATVSFDGIVRTWDAVTGQPRLILTPTGHSNRVTAVAIAPDGTWLATGSFDGTVRTWNASTGRPRGLLIGHRHRVTGVAIAPDGTWLATASMDQTARTWDAPTGQRRLISRTITSPATAVAIPPHGSRLATASNDGTARTWDAPTGKWPRIKHPHTGPVTAVAIAPDGTWLATTSHDKTAQIRDAVTGQPHLVLTGHSDLVDAVAIAPDGTWLATASDNGTVQIWDVLTGPSSRTRIQPRLVLTGHLERVTGVAIAPDGTWLATASRDQTAQIWDAVTGQSRLVLTGHSNFVDAVAIAPDGTWLATASMDQTARTWDAATGQPRLILTGHNASVTAVAIAPDGTWLATTSLDGTIRIWDTAGAARAVMRADSPLHHCTWSPSGSLLAATGEAGLYLYAFTPGTRPADHSPKQQPGGS